MPSARPTLNAVRRAVFTNSAAIRPTTVLITREFHLVGPLTRVYILLGSAHTAVLIARERCLVGPLTRVYIRQFEGFQHTIYTRVISPTAVLITRKFHLVGPLTRVYIVCWNRREKVRTFIFASIMIDQLMKQFLTYVSRFEGRLKRISPT